MNAMVEPLPLVAGNMDHGRQPALRMAERFEQPQDPVKRQIDPLRMQGQEARAMESTEVMSGSRSHSGARRHRQIFR